MSKSADGTARDRLEKYVQGGGEMGKLILDYDWSASPLGPVSAWPQSLLTALGIVMHSSFPMFLFWGKELISFYNDAYRPSLGNNGKHPAIGKRGEEVWSDIWEFVKPIIQQVMSTGKPAWFENQLVPFFRNNKVEDIYWTFSHSAGVGDDGHIEGVLSIVKEVVENHNGIVKAESSPGGGATFKVLLPLE